MKWNWGTKLVVSMAAFMTMVIVFVVLMMQQSVDLVRVITTQKDSTSATHR